VFSIDYPPTPGMQRSHQILFQYFMTKGVEEDTKLKSLYKDIGVGVVVPVNDATFENVIETINVAIRPMAFEIRQLRYELDGVLYWGLVNTINDDISKVASGFSESEVLYFKAMIQHMLEHEGVITTNEALSKRTKNESVDDAMRFVTRLLEQKWFQPCPELVDTYFVGSRTFLEMGHLLVVSEPQTCVLCKQNVLKPVRCENRSCSAIYHRTCFHDWFLKKPCQVCKQ